MFPELRYIEVPPEHRWTPPVKRAKPSKVQQTPVLFEVHFRCESEIINRSADEIAEELGDALELQDLGAMMTMDSAGVDSDFEVILEVDPRRTKSALRQIRTVLKRLKAPADTRILEVRDTETLEHPLIAPAKQQ